MQHIVAFWLTERWFHDAVTEVALAADRIRTGDTETRHSNSVGCSLTKAWEYGVAYATAVDDVFLVEWVVSVERCVVDEETVYRTMSIAVQLYEYQTFDHLNITKIKVLEGITNLK